jgi:hypothetical protein
VTGLGVRQAYRMSKTTKTGRVYVETKIPSGFSQPRAMDPELIFPLEQEAQARELYRKARDLPGKGTIACRAVELARLWNQKLSEAVDAGADPSPTPLTELDGYFDATMDPTKHPIARVRAQAIKRRPGR